MFVIGLTGGIACGKSEVSKRLQERGLPIVDADVVAREVVEPGTPVLSQLVEYFGDGILGNDGTLDRKRLGNLVFSDRDMLEHLNAIIHPAIWKRTLEHLGELAEVRHCQVAVLVAPLLLEHGAEALTDAVWVVSCSEEVQMQRLCRRDNLNESQARARLQAQMPLSSKCERADYVLENEGDLTQLDEQIDMALSLLDCRLNNTDDTI